MHPRLHMQPEDASSPKSQGKDEETGNTEQHWGVGVMGGVSSGVMRAG